MPDTQRPADEHADLNDLRMSEAVRPLYFIFILTFMSACYPEVQVNLQYPDGVFNLDGLNTAYNDFNSGPPATINKSFNFIVWVDLN